MKKVIMLKPEHISAYSLMIEEGTLFYEWYGEEGESGKIDVPVRSILPGDGRNRRMELPPLPDEDTDREIYHLTGSILGAQGYGRYEISNYARPGYECRHNIGYWTGVDYLGLGLGASSYIGGFRYHNVTELREYLSLDLKVAGAAARDIKELTLEEKKIGRAHV